jgi:hypothetical protein
MRCDSHECYTSAIEMIVIFAVPDRWVGRSIKNTLKKYIGFFKKIL